MKYLITFADNSTQVITSSPINLTKHITCITKLSKKYIKDSLVVKGKGAVAKFYNAKDVEDSIQCTIAELEELGFIVTQQGVKT